MEMSVDSIVDGPAAARPRGAPAGPRAVGGYRVAAIAVATGLLVLVLGLQTESLVIGLVGTTGHQLEWISDVVAAVAVTSVTYLWLHLRAARARLLDSERVLVALDEQFRMAAEIQKSLLPNIPAETPGYLWAARMEAAHQVCGDFYDFVEVSGGSALLILGDVSGKGMPAALLQSSVSTLFRVYAAITTDPREIAGRMSEALFGQTGGRPYATAILARLDRSPRRITYVNAGHPAGVVRRGSDILELNAGGPPLGLLPAAAYECGTLDLRPADLGVLLTDGVTEAIEGIPLKIGDALAESRLAGTATPAQGCDYLLRVAASGAGPPGAGAWFDDRTVLAFRVQDAWSS
jgi:serine phosphatase RsbU (regulator of sigma subunit)